MENKHHTSCYPGLQLADRRWSRSIEDSSISWNVLLSISRQKSLAQALRAYRHQSTE